MKENPHFLAYEKIITKLYGDIDGMAISLNERKRDNIQDSSLTYGETTFTSFATHLKIVNPQPGEVFYDLGSGSGKAVFMAALLFDFAKSWGVEKLNDLYDLSQQQLNQFQTLPEITSLKQTKNFDIQFFKQDIMDFDFSDGDIIYINATCFVGDFWNAILAKMDQLKIGSRFILASRRLPVEKYTVIEERLDLMSWGMNSINIYQKIA